VVLAIIAGVLPALVQTQTPPQTRDPRAAAPPPAGTGVIGGTLSVVDTGRPARQARVAISGGDPRTVKSVTTDDQGHFVFTDLPAGAFTLTATKPGFLDVAYGQRRPGSGRAGTPIQLAAGQKLDRIALQIPRGGVITGTVIDSFGDPMFNTQVRAMRYVMRNGLRTLQSAGSGNTDDRGVYRIPALLPGDYVVSAMPRDSQAAMEVEMVRAKIELTAALDQSAAKQSTELFLRDQLLAVQSAAEQPTSGYAQTYHPGASQLASASTVTLDISEEKPAIDLRLQIVPFATVSGIVTAPSALPKGTQVQMVETGQPIPGLNTRSTRVGADGRFSFPGVPPGQYQITARANVQTEVYEMAAAALDRAKASLDMTLEQKQNAKATLASDPPAESLWAMTDLAVNGGNITDVSLSLQKGMSISGSVVFDGGNTASLDLTKMRVTLAAAPDATSPSFGDGMAMPDAAVDSSGRFMIRGVIPGKYRVVPGRGFPAGFTIESSVFAGRDILDIPLEVRAGEDQGGGIMTFGTAQTELAGTLRDNAGKPVPDYTLVVFAADQRMWLPASRRIQAVRPATDGRFAFKGLPPGEYRLAALVDVEQGQWFDPAFLREIAGAGVPVSLGKGEKKTQDLNVAR
jgi:protocatechuate 3,4-dioxygenase beta subunit